MVINKMNYEQFALDYLEGTLDERTQALMEHFLTENQDIKAELDGMALFALEADDTIIFEDKAVLIQPVAIRSVAWWQYAAAAIVLLGIGFGIAQMTMNNEDISTPNLAEKPAIEIPVETPSKKLETTHEAMAEVSISTPRKKTIPTSPHSSKKNISKPKTRTIPTKKQLNPNLTALATVESTPQINQIPEPVDSEPKNEVFQTQKNEVIASVTTKKTTSKPIASNLNKEALTMIENTNTIASIQPRDFETDLPEIELDIPSKTTELAEKEKGNRLQKMGLLPEGSNGKFNFKKLKEALLPEAFAEAD